MNSCRLFLITDMKNKPIIVNVPQTVRVRKYPVDIKGLQDCLRNAKCLSNKQISEKLNVPTTMVEHWFRTDKCFSVPSEDKWFELKSLLSITTDKFDESIMTFEEKIGNYDMSERCYYWEGVSPTLTLNCANNKYIVEVQNEH